MWMYKRERRQRRLKEHYEEQFGQNFAYRRTVVVGSSGGDGDGESAVGVGNESEIKLNEVDGMFEKDGEVERKVLSGGKIVGK